MHHLEMSVRECSNTSAPIELSIASTSVTIFLMLITIPTNLLVCLAIMIDPNRELKTQFNCFTFNLALADLLVGCIAEPASIYAHVTEALATKRGHEVNPVVVKMFHVPYFISAMASVLTIAALAFERYLAINSPFRYRKYFNVKLTVVFSTSIWIIAISFGLLNLIFDYTFESFIFINSGVLFTGAIVSLTCCSIRANLRKASKQLQLNVIQMEREKLRERDHLIQVKLTKTFALMTGMLMLCYVPACSIVYFINVCKHCNCELIQWFRDVAFWLVLLNSAIDPYVYAVRSSSFRDAISKVIKCRKRQYHKPQRLPSIKFTKGKVKQHNNKTTSTYGSVDTSTDDNQCEIEQAPLI